MAMKNKSLNEAIDAAIDEYKRSHPKATWAECRDAVYDEALNRYRAETWPQSEAEWTGLAALGKKQTVRR